MAAHVGDIFQHRFLLLNLRRGEGWHRLLRRRGGGFAQLANELLPGGVVFKDVGKRTVGGFFLFNIGFRRRRILLGRRGSGGHAGDRDGERRRTKQANQQQQDPRHGVLR